MRLHPALALAAILLPAVAAAQTDEWVRDDMSDESLWLLRTSNLAREAPRSATLPGAPDGGSQWVMSKGDGPAYVVYFIPGRIHEVEIDTHRLAGASGDFSLAVSTDGRLYQPLDAGAVLLDSSFGWDYRLMSSDQIPDDATHLLVQFPDGSTAHSLSEVWIRYTWDDALVSRFLPEPVAAPALQDTLAAHSDAELQAMLSAFMDQSAPPPAQEVFPIADRTPVTIAPPEFAAEPLRAPNLTENAAPVQFEAPQASETEVAAAELANELPAEAAASAPVAAESSEPAPAGTDTTSTIEPPEAEPEMEPVVEATPSVNEPELVAAENVSATSEPASDAAEIRTANIADAGEPTAALPPAESLAPADESREGADDEEVHVLPAFVLPVMVSEESSEAPTSPQFESPPQATAESVVLEPAPPAIAGAPPVEPAMPDSIELDPPAIESQPARADVQDLPAATQDPIPILTAASVAPADSSQHAEITTDDEPRAKPAMKMKRMGPRSKSRGTLVARDWAPRKQQGAGTGQARSHVVDSRAFIPLLGK